MAQFASISPTSLMRLLGTPQAPVIIDVCIDDDFRDDPFLIPTARRHAHRDLEAARPELAGENVVVVCQKGLKLSQGVAAVLRTYGIRTEVLEGGNLAWRDAGMTVYDALYRWVSNGQSETNDPQREARA